MLKSYPSSEKDLVYPDGCLSTEFLIPLPVKLATQILIASFLAVLEKFCFPHHYIGNFLMMVFHISLFPLRPWHAKRSVFKYHLKIVNYLGRDSINPAKTLIALTKLAMIFSVITFLKYDVTPCNNRKVLEDTLFQLNLCISLRIIRIMCKLF